MSCFVYEMEWSDAKVMELIESYRCRPLLWDCSLREYKNKSLRHSALEEIAAAYGVSIEEIERKIKNLRGHFSREVRKENETSGSGSDSCYRSKWFCYDSFMFLKHRYKPSESIDTESSISEEKLDIRTKHVEQLLEPTAQSKDDAKKRKSTSPIICDAKRRETGQIKSIVTAGETTSIPKEIRERIIEKDEYSMFGEQIAIKLRRLPSPYAKVMVQHIINTTLLEAEMGKYNNPTGLLHPVAMHAQPPLFNFPAEQHESMFKNPRSRSNSLSPADSPNPENTDYKSNDDILLHME